MVRPEIDHKLVAYVHYRIPSVVREVLQDFCSPRAVVAGGFIRDATYNYFKQEQSESVVSRDIDIFVLGDLEERRSVAHTIAYRIAARNPYNQALYKRKASGYLVCEAIGSDHKPIEVQVIYRCKESSVAKLLENFDFYMCQAAFVFNPHPETLIFSDKYLECAVTRTLKFNADIRQVPYRSLERYQRFIERGFTPCPEAEKDIEARISNFENRLKSPELLSVIEYDNFYSEGDSE